MPRELKPCGTKAAYERHRRNKEIPCAACKEANSKETSKYLRKKYWKDEEYRFEKNLNDRIRNNARYEDDPEYRRKKKEYYEANKERLKAKRLAEKLTDKGIPPEWKPSG